MSLERRAKKGFFRNLTAAGLIFTALTSLIPAYSNAICSAKVISQNSENEIYVSDIANMSGTSTIFERAKAKLAADKPDPWLRAQMAVKKRYHQHDISTLVKQYNRADSFDLLLQVWQLINYYYYNDITANELLNNALTELKAVTSDPEIRQKYNISSMQAAKLKSYIDQQRTLLQSNVHIDYSLVKQTLNNISDYCQDTGLESSWPVIETIFALCGNLDRYSNYIMPEKYNTMMESLKGNYEGIGTDLIFRGFDYPLVFDILPGSPAETAGILPGDLLIKLNSVELNNISDYEFDGIFLTAHNTMSLTVKRDDKYIDLTVEKAQLHSSTVRNTCILSGTKTGYFRITSFDKNTDSEISNSLSELSEECDSLIIDVRNNGGGMVTSAVNAADLFLSEGNIVSIRSFSAMKSYNAGADNKKSEEIPIYILVNRHTASAAEIFTAALKQNCRAIVIGEKTFGKAMVQTVYDLRHNAGAVMLTTAEYLPPSHESFNLKGITPDIEVIDTEKQEYINSHQCIYERISRNNPVMNVALNCVSR